MKLINNLKDILTSGAKNLKGHARRIFMAQAVKGLGKGGHSNAEKELGWNRGTIRKGIKELESNFICYENFSGRGRKRIEEHLPHLLDDIKDIVDSQSQTDPRFKTMRLYTRLSAEEVRQQLMIQKDYEEQELPTEETIRRKLNQLGSQKGKKVSTSEKNS